MINHKRRYYLAEKKGSIAINIISIEKPQTLTFSNKLHNVTYSKICLLIMHNIYLYYSKTWIKQYIIWEYMQFEERYNTKQVEVVTCPM